MGLPPVFSSQLWVGRRRVLLDTHNYLGHYSRGVSEQLAEGLAEGTVTVLFTDIEGSTDLGSKTGDHSAHRVVRAHDEIVRSRVLEHGGREIKSLGDGLMVAFTSARRAVACAIDIKQGLDRAREEAPEDFAAVRIGLNAGEVIMEGGDLFGSAVSAASRITAQARGQQILVSDVVKTLVGKMPEASFRDLGPVELKGFEEPLRLFEVLWARATPGTPGGGRTPFVGRQKERAELSRRLDQLPSGSGALVLIGGEPGIGKTRLAEETAAEANRKDFRTLVGRCYDVDAPPPYLPFVEILEAASREVDKETFRMALGESAGEIAKVMPQLRNLYDDIPPSLDLPPEQERRYLFNSIVEFVRRASSTRPLVVLLDDLQWADESSLSLLRTVAQHLKDIPVLLIGTYRNVELDVHRPLSRALDDLLRQRLAQRINLKRLDEESVQAMLERLSGKPPPERLVRVIYEETDGNAFFVEEVFRHLIENHRLFDDEGQWVGEVEIGEIEVPESVRLVIGRRLEGLHDQSRKALAAAAIIGRTFDYQQLEALEEVGPDELLDAIEEAQRLTLVEPLSSSPNETRFQFGHELIRQTLLSAMGLPRRQRLHLRVAQATESLYPDTLEERAPEIVNHLVRAGVGGDGMTVRYLLLAGRRAQDSAAFDEALHYFEQALELVDDDDEAAGRALLGLGQAQRSLGRFEDAMANWRKALDLYETRGDPGAMAQVAYEIVMQLGWAGQWASLLEMAGRVLGRLGSEPTPERALLLAWASAGLGWAGDYENSKPMLDEAMDLAQQLGDDQLRGQCLGLEGTHLYAYGSLSRSIDTGLEAMDLLRETKGQWNYVSSLAFVTIGLTFSGRSEEATPFVEELTELSERLGFVHGTMFANRSRFWGEWSRTGDIEVGETFSRADLELCEAHNLPWVGQSHVFMGRTKLFKGEIEAALDHLRKGTEMDPPGALHGFGLGTLFMALAYLRRRDEAMGLWDEITSEWPESGKPNPMGKWNLLGYAVEGLFVLEDYERTAELYEIAGEVLETGFPFRWDGRPLETVVGLTAAAAGRWEAAHGHFQRAIRMSEGGGPVSERFETRRLYGTALLNLGAPGDDDRARELLAAALDGYRELGLPLHIEWTERLLSKVGTPS